MNEPVDWQHRESLRMWSVLAARGHDGAQLVANHYGLVPPAVLPPAPAPVRAVVPEAPRAVAPAVPTPTPALSGVQRRVDKLARLVNPPATPTDLV